MSSSFSKIRYILLTLCSLLIVSCQTPAPAPVSERAQPPTRKILHHYVSSGETLYTISWKYELDFQKLAAVNGLPAPYRLHVGQKLSLDTSRSPPRQPAPSSGKPSAAKAYPVTDSSLNPGATLPPKITLPEAPPLPKAGWQWQWPVRGRVAREYDPGKILKGISIYTQPRSAVVAAAPGVVVYEGEGLRGYGRLIIVKHSNKHLSAYAHNHRILVKENQSVMQGEKIAEVGMDSANRPRLYFEIRENGKPVDPLKRLPK